MIIETSCNRFYQVSDFADPNLAHVWNGIEVKRVKGTWVAKKNARPSLVRKEASRIVQS
jgi:hypothetical protein